MKTKKVCIIVPGVKLKNGTTVKPHVRCKTVEVDEPEGKQVNT